jgi:hypothetical protein
MYFCRQAKADQNWKAKFVAVKTEQQESLALQEATWSTKYETERQKTSNVLKAKEVAHKDEISVLKAKHKAQVMRLPAYERTVDATNPKVLELDESKDKAGILEKENAAVKLELLNSIGKKV